MVEVSVVRTSVVVLLEHIKVDTRLRLAARIGPRPHRHDTVGRRLAEIAQQEECFEVVARQSVVDAEQLVEFVA
jgi:hypothetical protein